MDGYFANMAKAKEASCKVSPVPVKEFKNIGNVQRPTDLVVSVNKLMKNVRKKNVECKNFFARLVKFSKELEVELDKESEESEEPAETEKQAAPLVTGKNPASSTKEMSIGKRYSRTSKKIASKEPAMIALSPKAKLS